MKRYLLLGLVITSVMGLAYAQTGLQKTFVFHTGTSQLTITGDSAVMSEPCGELSIKSGWNELGKPMTGFDQGGPLIRPGIGSNETVTATIGRGGILVKAGDSDPVLYVPGKMEHPPFECL